jgi:4-hydroxy-2-oxoheptanedioate aldolase
MEHPATETLRSLWAAGEVTFGAWLTMPSPVSAEAAARIGFDYVCVDTQHGATDYQMAVYMIQAIILGGSRPVVRVPWNEPGVIGKMLDAGAIGVVIPMVNTAREAEEVVRACRYPPLGERSFGPVMAGMRTPDYAVEANEMVALIPMIETAEALSNLDDILAVPGLDAVYVGPADLSLSLGLLPGNNDGSPEFDDALDRIVAACRDAGVVPGIHASGVLASRRVQRGFAMVTVANDLLAMRTRMTDELAEACGVDKSDGNARIY